ncbi:hypothetical protein CBS101457_000323 [Exobasidium rhododendri]|nr:hypothetical protein CBS101457_000323 [Exobasidium rhododendri]
MSSFEGFLSLQEAHRQGEWTQRWCVLSSGTLNIYLDRNTASTRPERFIRAVPLSTYQKLRASGDYGAHGTGQWELTLLGEASVAANNAVKARGIPRSSTSNSLYSAFDRGPPSSKRPVAANVRSRKSNDNLSAERAGMNSSSTWHNKFASKSKRLYQLMSGSGSSQSLSEQYHASAPSHNGSDVDVSIHPSHNDGPNSEHTGDHHAVKAASFPAQTSLVLQATDAHSMALWADAFSRCLYGPASQQPSAPSPALSTASLITLPSHARKRRPALATVTDDFNTFYGVPPTNSSSLMSAAMASQRKRQDSNLNKSANQLLESCEDSYSSEAYTLNDSDRIPEKKATMTAADKFVKARRRASTELISAVSLTRKSGEGESIHSSRPTTSSGTSARSSFYCRGEQSSTRISMERSSLSFNGHLNSLASFSSPLLGTLRRSSSRKSTSSQSTRNSVQFGNGNSAHLASIFPSSILQSNNESSKAGDDGSKAVSSPSVNSSSNASQSTFPLSSPQTPSMHMFETVSSAEHSSEGEPRDRFGLLRGSHSVLGLNLYLDNKDYHTQQPPQKESPQASSFCPDLGYLSEAVIVESPSKEDLATLLNSKGREEKEKEVMKLSVTNQSRHANKLVSSPSLPTLHQSFFRPSNDNLKQYSTTSSSPPRSSSSNKMSSRKTGLIANRLYPPKPAPVAGSTANIWQSPKKTSRQSAMSSSQSGNVKFRTKNLVGEGRWGSEIKKAVEAGKVSGPASNLVVIAKPPVMERILPPEEMIATIDRLRGQESSSSLRSAGKASERSNDAAKEGGVSATARVRERSGNHVRPRTSPSSAYLCAEEQSSTHFAEQHQAQHSSRQADHRGTFDSSNDSTNAITNKWETGQRLRSLPAPPRLNRKSRLNVSSIRGGPEAGMDKENNEMWRLTKSASTMTIGQKPDSSSIGDIDDYSNSGSNKLDRLAMMDISSQQQQQQPLRILRSSISENFSTNMTLNEVFP